MLELEKPVYRFVIAVLAIFLLLGMIADGPVPALTGLVDLQRIPTRLISDFTVIAGTGATLLNAAIVGAGALIITWLCRIRLSGPTLATIFTMMGFSLFGTTPLNAAPILAGVWIASRIARTPFSHYILIAFFGSAIGPVTNFLAYETGLHGVPAMIAGAGAGVAAGIVLPAIAMSMLRLHEGFSLYNLGLASGFIGLFLSSILAAAGHDVSLAFIWNEVHTPLLSLLVPGISVLAIAWGFAMERKNALTGFLRIMKLSGRLPSDFMDMVSPGAGLVNMGAMGLLASAYVSLVSGDFNGPVIGGLLTIFGFGSFGKHPRNCWPVLAGVVGATLIFNKPIDAPGPLLAALFGTTLAPLAGEFGPFAGILGGFIHLALVERSAAWHGGLNLYNNGFSGGLVAILFVAVLEWYRSNKSK